MQAMILIAPPQAGQVSMSIPKTRFRRRSGHCRERCRASVTTERPTDDRSYSLLANHRERRLSNPGVKSILAVESAPRLMSVPVTDLPVTGCLLTGGLTPDYRTAPSDCQLSPNRPIA